MDFSCPDPLYSKYEESCEMKAGELQGLGQPEQQLLAEAEFLGGKGKGGGAGQGCGTPSGGDISSQKLGIVPSSAPQIPGWGSSSALGGG